MIRKKIINIVTAAAVILQLIPGTAAFAAEYGETKTELVNVAKFKPVSTSRGPVDSTLTNLVDDHNDTDLIVSYSNGEQWIKIDLQRRFKISHIEIASRCTSANSIWLSDFEIQASNDESFSKYQVLDSCLSQDGESLPKLGSENMTFNGSEDTAYRYVRVYANHMMGFSEIRIYANQTVTQIL